MHGIEPQFLALQKGFNELIPQSLLKSFDERELELVIGGLGKIDLDDWKANTRLKNCQIDTKQVGLHYFKNFLKSFIFFKSVRGPMKLIQLTRCLVRHLTYLIPTIIIQNDTVF